jgi:putative oxygen-independent coproporphyrinogen III oxidase
VTGLGAAAAGEPSPDDAGLADAAQTWRSAYVHVPFCHRRCPYCDFAVVTPEEGGGPDRFARYVDAVLAEIDREEEWGPLDAVDFGGGTPSRLPAAELGRIVAALRNRFGLVENAEVSLEANPEDWTEAAAAAVAAAGFTRVSLGAQSFDPAVLEALGRRHRPEHATAAIAAALAAGFRTVNVDLIYGTPGESAASWASSVARALDSGVQHLSAYALTVERGTALSRAVAAGAAAPDPDVQADAYDHLEAVAPAAGLVRYEVSNWARPGHGCVYNLGTWAQGEYLGFGLGAHSHRDGTRRRNVRRLDVYLERVERGERPEAGRERLSSAGREQERLFLGLRRAAGAISGEAGSALLATAAGRRLVASGVIEERDGRLRVLRPLLTDAVLREIPGEA